MGSGTYDYDASAARRAFRTTSGVSAFVHTSRIASGAVAPGTHPTLDPTLKNIRECRDNPDNPESVPIVVMVDVTGSMGRVADDVLDNLDKIVRTISEDGPVKNPSLLFGAMGDAFFDRSPIQVGEFEASDLLAQTHLGNIYREKGGGGNQGESYDLSCWFIANQIRTDHWEKRGRKGFVFIVADEPVFDVSLRTHIQKFIGIDPQGDVPMTVTMDRLQERWHVFVLRPALGLEWYSSEEAHGSWCRYLPEQHVVRVPNWEQINGIIATTISVLSGSSVASAIKAASNAGLDTSGTDTVLAQIAPDESEIPLGMVGSSSPVALL